MCDHLTTLPLILRFLAAMGENRTDSKRRKISDMRAALPFCSQTALAAICTEIAKKGLPEKTSRFAIWKETKEFLDDASMSMYGPLFQSAEAATVDNAKKNVLFINFLSLLAGAFGKGGAFTSYLLQAHRNSPSTLDRPWRCVAYTDEMHPGNMLNSSSRKAWCIYIGFLEMGRFLTKSDCWFCIAISRSSEVSTLASGMSQMFRLVLESTFADGRAETGLLLTSPLGDVRLHFALGMVLQDGAAHRAVWACRQDTGLKPCLCCKNLFQLRDAGSLETADSKIFAKFLKRSQLQVATDGDILSSWQRLQARSEAVSAHEFHLLQQAAGLTFSKHALLSSEKLLANHVLKPISAYCYDYMHGLCSHGVLNDTIFLVLDSIHSAGYNVWDKIQDWIAVWVFPKAYNNSNVVKLFDVKNVTNSKKARTFKCDASDILALYKPLQYVLQVMYVANNVMVEQCACFVAWATVLDYLVSLPFLEHPSPPKLLALVESALAATVAAGFKNEMKPKHHWTLHYADCLAKFGQLPSCWSLERKHKTPRKYGGTHCNLSTYEKGLMTAVTMEHLNILVSNTSLFSNTCHLVDPKELTKKLEVMFKDINCFVAGMQYSNSCILANGATCNTEDFVFLAGNGSWTCGKAKYFFNAAGMLLCLVDVYQLCQRKPHTASSKWEPTGPLQLLNLDRILQVAIYAPGKDGKAIVLTPAPLSCQE